MSKHTPGPWKSDDAWNINSGKIVVRDDPTGEEVAQIWGGNEEAMANARLIASAPNLLEALKLCQSALATMIAPDAIKSTTVINAFAQATEADAKARAAIAKATASTPVLERV